MIHYNSTVLYEFAERLYKRAARVTLSYTVIFAVGGLLAGVVLADVTRALPDNAGAIIGLLLGGVVGLVLGAQRAFALRLHAQTLLCQVAIEEHSRGRAELV